MGRTRGGIDMLIGFALGYLALTDEGRTLGNKMADAAVKVGKKAMQNYLKKPDCNAAHEPNEKEEK